MTLPKTKIVATMGVPRPGVSDRTGRRSLKYKKGERAKTFWDAFLPMFFQGDKFMLDVLRLNMNYFELPGDNELQIFKWLSDHKARLKNVAVLGDLPGPKVRLAGLPEEGFPASKDRPIAFIFRGQSRGDLPYICVRHELLGKADRRVAVEIDRFLPPNGPGLMAEIGDTGLPINIVDRDNNILKCVTMGDGIIENNDSVSFKGLPLNLRSFDKLDMQALDFLIEHGIDCNEDLEQSRSQGSFLAFVGVSFVKTRKDIIDVKRYAERKIKQKLELHPILKKRGKLSKRARLLAPAIIAKIETKEAWHNIHDILDVADGVMVARGDLARQMDPHEVPEVQKKLIRLCNLRGKPVITATQMLATMEKNRYPTRAEATDVFNAILDGTDAVMLSEETSKGIYPSQAVTMMGQIATEAERFILGYGKLKSVKNSERRRLNVRRFEDVLIDAEELIDDIDARLKKYHGKAIEDNDKWLAGLYAEKIKKSQKQRTTDCISMGACMLSNGSPGYKAILAPSTSGRTARMISRFRPEAIIIGAAHDILNRKKMALSYGVYPINCGRVAGKSGSEMQNPNDVFRICRRIALREDYLIKGDEVVCTAGTRLFVPGATNLIRVDRV